MANTILHKRSSAALAVPATLDLSLGELAVNTYDGKLYLKKNDGVESIVPIGGIENVVEDLTPQLGGNLDTNSFNIVTTNTVGAVVDNIAIVAGASAYAAGGTGVAGGSIAVAAGQSDNVGGDGGSILLIGGAATVDGVGGAVTITAGAGTGVGSAAGGAITLTAGDSDTSLPGNIVIAAGATPSAGAVSGTVSILTPDSVTGYVGDITISSGNTTYVSGSGSDINLFAGDSGALGGNIVLQPGNGLTTGGALPSRAITIQDAVYGAVGFMRAGNNSFDLFTNSSEGGTAAINITSGDSLTFGTAGDINITAGSGTAASGIGGSIVITPGASAVAGPPPAVKFPSPNPAGFTGGMLQIYEASNANYTIIATAASLAGPTRFLLPPDGGTNGFVLSTDGTGATTWITPPVSGLQNVVEDLTPQLGGDLDTNNFNIVGTTGPLGISNNVGITLTAGDTGTQTSGSVDIVNGYTSGGYQGQLRIFSDNANYVRIAPPTGLAAYTNFILPPDNGTSGFVLSTDGFGYTTWITSPGLQNVVEDATPQLGGDLDVSLYDIIGTPGTTTQGGLVRITGGTAVAASAQRGGAVTIAGGASDGIALAGDVDINGGWANGDGTGTGVGGIIRLRPGASASGTPSTVQIHGASSGDQAEVRFFDNASAGGSVYVGLKAPTVLVTSQTYTLPLVDGAAGDVMQTDGAGILSFADLKHIAINAQVGTAYTLVLTDDNKLVTMNNAAANILTVPDNATVAFPIGTQIIVEQEGAGQTTIAAGAGVTLNSAGGLLSLASQYSSLTLIKKATDTWLVAGDLV